MARAVRARGYPVTLFMLVHLVAVRPLQSLAGFLLMLVELLPYGVATVQARSKASG